MAQAAPETVILAEDEASLYLQATTMAVWGPRGHPLVVRCDPGRAKTNFYGTLNLQTGDEIVTEATTMNAAATATHLRAILAAYPDVPILRLWDRAPWHRGPEIQEVLTANPRLELITFPTAAPDLNPQEHVWKATRRAVSHNHTHREMQSLAQRFEQHLTSNTFTSSFLHRYGWTLVCPMSV
ncbi:MAG: IS630 family transposase [Chloroflexota bacterium]|nr:IS630 family transposase [Chloroflexota bacterium]